MISVTLPFPPTVNSYYSHTKRGVYISKKGRLFREAAAESLHQQLGDLRQLDYRISLTVVLHMPDKRTRDLDNYMKALLDAITVYGLWEDDSQIDQLSIYRGETVKSGIVKLVIDDAGPTIPLSFDATLL